MKAGGSFANIPGIMCQFYKIVIYRCAKFTSIESVELYLTYFLTGSTGFTWYFMFCLPFPAERIMG